MGEPVNAEETGPRFALAADDGYVCVVWNEDVTVSEQDALDLLHRLEAVSPGRCDPMMVILNSMVSLDASALATFASRLNVSALALVGPSAVDRLIATFFNDVHRPRYPTRYFPEAAAAREWLLTPGHGTPET